MDTNNPGQQPREPQRLEVFNLIYIILQLIGLTIIILMASWVFGYLGGLSWSSTPSIQFNWHPLLMSIGMIYLYGNCKSSENLRRCSSDIVGAIRKTVS